MKTSKIHKLKLQVGRRIFLIFLIVWLGLIACAFIAVMFKFKNWLTNYQAAYEGSRPYLTMDVYYEWFKNADIDTIYDNMSEKPLINEYETEENAKRFMTQLLDPTKITYSESKNFSEPVPEYMVLSGDYIVSTLRFRKSTTESKEYSFPVWELTYLDYYCEPQYDVYISIPETVTATVNGRPLEEKYCYMVSEPLSDQQVFGDYATLPLIKKYKIENFYQLPVIEAVNDEGYAANVTFNENTGIFEVDFGNNPNVAEMKSTAVDSAKIFAGYLANEVWEGTMVDRFVPGCKIIRNIIAGREDAGKFFKFHSSIEYTNISVDRFTCYNSDTFSCDVHMDQEIYRYADTPFEIAQVNYRFYYVKLNGVWKACYVSILQTRE